MKNQRLAGEEYTDEEKRVLKRICKAVLADIEEWERRKKKKGGKLGKGLLMLLVVVLRAWLD